jgi:hypothetical protein
VFDEEFVEGVGGRESERGRDAGGEAVPDWFATTPSDGLRAEQAEDARASGTKQTLPFLLIRERRVRAPGVFEGIVGGECGACFLQRGAHGAGDVVFVVEAVGDEGDEAARDDFADEDDATAEFVVDCAADVEAKIDFREACVAGNGNAEQAAGVETEADDADVGLALVEVGSGAGWSERCDRVCRYGEIE